MLFNFPKQRLGRAQFREALKKDPTTTAAAYYKYYSVIASIAALQCTIPPGCQWSQTQLPPRISILLSSSEMPGE